MKTTGVVKLSMKYKKTEKISCVCSHLFKIGEVPNHPGQTSRQRLAWSSSAQQRIKKEANRFIYLPQWN